jgi:hypothetical protein
MKALGLALTLAVATQAGATISRAIPFEDKVDNAASIILGKVTDQSTRWDAAHKWILTYSTFRIEKSMKGQPAQEITIVTPGGVVNGIHQETIGVPKFDVGDDHVVFVRNTHSGPTVLYFDQGDYAVESVRGDRIVRPAVSNAVLVDTQRGMAVAPESVSTLRDFEERVHERMRAKQEIEHMQIMEQQRRADSSLRSVLERNKLLVALALVGALLATIQLIKRW